MIDNIIRASGKAFYKYKVNNQVAETYADLDDTYATIDIFPNDEFYTENFHYFFEDTIPEDAEVTFNTVVSIDDIFFNEEYFIIISGMISSTLSFMSEGTERTIDLRIPYEKKLNLTLPILPKAIIYSTNSTCHHVDNKQTVIIITVMIDFKFT